MKAFKGSDEFMVTTNTDWVREIESLDKAKRKYIIEFEGKIYEADN